MKLLWPVAFHKFRIQSDSEDASSDLLVYSNGSIVHTVTINADVNCEVNLFNYPFAADACPIAVETWSIHGKLTNNNTIV